MVQLAALAILVGAFGYRFSIDDVKPKPKFEVRLIDSPKDGPHIPMLSDGIEYQCYVPDRSDWVQRQALGKPSKEEIEAASAAIAGTKDCSYRIDGYWAYELCHNDCIWQLHPIETKEGEYVFPKYGKSSHAFLLGNVSGPPSAEARGGKWHLKVPYHGGARCDLTGEPRTADVLYVCDKDVEGEEIIIGHETQVCVYEFIVSTSKTCGIFEEVDSPVNYIECYVEGGFNSEDEIADAAKKSFSEESDRIEEVEPEPIPEFDALEDSIQETITVTTTHVHTVVSTVTDVSSASAHADDSIDDDPESGVFDADGSKPVHEDL